MIIVDERHFLKKQLVDQGFDVFDFFENHQILDLSTFCQLPLQRKADILLVDTQSVIDHPELQEKFQTVLNTFLGALFFHEEQNEKAFNWVQNQASYMKKIVGNNALPMPELHWTMLSNQLQFFWNILEEQRALQKHITAFSSELDQVLQTAEWEMNKAKKVHEILIPKRSDEIKGVRFLNKYAVGDGASGEFFDLHQNSNKVFQILISSQSYLISSALLGILGQHKQQPTFHPDIFLREAIGEIQTINSSKKKKSVVEAVILELDLNHLTLKVYGWGKTEFYSRTKGKVSLDLAPLAPGHSELSHYQLERGEKFIVFSPGFLFNWKEAQAKQDIHTFIKDHQQLNQDELIMELFFQVRHGKSSEFLSSDATVVMMEVNRHGIHQI